MANPTSNFGWQMPTPTDLVTDLPADFEVFGQAVDTSLADLKGGTSGQVLSKNSNTDMDFVWVTSDDANAIQNSIVDAKGDLIAASANDTPARLAVGNNGETLVADSSTSTGLRYQGTMAAAKNSIINGGFDIWQRGTSFVPSTTAFGPDRWQVYRNTTGCTASRQTPGSTLPQFQYCARMQRDSGTTAANSASYAMSLETSESLKYAGQTITLSFYARAGANFSGSGASSMRVYLAYGTGTDQNIISGFTGVTYLVNGTVTAITTSWVRYSFTVAVPSTATQLGLELNALFNGTAGAADYFEVAGVQLELGSVPTTFSRAGGTIQGELAACQRYYYRTANDSSFAQFAAGVAVNTTDFSAYLQMPVTMRVAPTAVEYSNLRTIDGPNDYGAPSSVTINTYLNNRNVAAFSVIDTGYTAYRPMYLQANNNAAAYLAVTAEL